MQSSPKHEDASLTFYPLLKWHQRYTTRMIQAPTVIAVTNTARGQGQTGLPILPSPPVPLLELRSIMIFRRNLSRNNTGTTVQGPSSLRMRKLFRFGHTTSWGITAGTPPPSCVTCSAYKPFWLLVYTSMVMCISRSQKDNACNEKEMGCKGH